MRNLLIAAILAAGTACAAGTSGGSDTGSGGRGDALTQAQLAATGGSNAYDAVARLRPRWLMARAPNTLQPEGNPVLVYVDGQRMGGVEQLRAFPVESISQIVFVSASDATTRYGTGHASGVIEVTTKRSSGR